MSFRLIDAHGPDDLLITVQGRQFPNPSLVEDSEGIRWFLTDGFLHIRPALWARATAAGAVGLLSPLASGGWAVITAEGFQEDRTEGQGYYHLARGWREFPSPPSYAELMRPAPKIIVPGKGFVHLHTHTEYSSLDGRTRVPELVREVVADGQQAVAATDHGNCAAHPVLQKEAAKAGIKPVFGIEAYFVHDRLRRPRKWLAWPDSGREVTEAQLAGMSAATKATLLGESDTKQVRDYHHVVLLAKTQQGLKNIWGASTESFRDGQYYNPRMDWETLRRFREGVWASSGCLRGPLAGPLLDGDEDLARNNLARMLDIYGDQFYIELHANSLPEQVQVNHDLVRIGREFGVPLVAVVDSHYPTRNDYLQHQAWIAVQTDSDVQDDTDLFAHDIGLYIQTEAEVRDNLSYLAADVVEESINNTVMIADSCDAEIPIRKVMPVFSREGGPERDRDRLIDVCLKNWDALTKGPRKPPQEDYIARFEREMGLLVPKGFCGYYLQVSDYVAKMKSKHIQVGPGRGSGGGSLVAYLSRITGIDPVEHDLPFERFMTKGRTALPDFDVDFPASRRADVQDYITERYGAEHVIRIGTHIRVRNKAIVKDLSRSLKSQLPETAWKDFDEVAQIIDNAESSTAGIGIPWDELWVQEGELLQPYRDKYPDLFDMADNLVGLLKSYGKHPAGLVVSDEILTDNLPLRLGEDDDGQMISQFGMNDLEDMGKVKFDILTLRTLDTIQDCVDLIRERQGIQIVPDDWQEEYYDPQVWEEISEGRTLGVFQVETAGGIRMCKKVRPSNLAEFADVLTLVRPGPMRSGLTDLYLDRRAGRSEVTFPDPRMAEVLGATYGAILYQEQVMQTCMILAGYDDDKADEVRKILGKKKVDLVVAAGREFVDGCAANGMDREAAEALWLQMAEFAKYSFGKAHAFGYAVLAYWTAWLKVHYPVEFFTAVLSTVKQNRIPEFVSEARRMGFQVLPPDINESGQGFSAADLGVRYGLDSLKGLGEKVLEKILPAQPFTSFEDFRERSGVDAGKTLLLARIGAFDSLGHNRRGLETLLLAEKDGTATQCQFKNPEVSGPNGLPCTFEWEGEPLPVNEKTGRTLKPRPIPKRCTKACRQYLAPLPMDPEGVEPYTEADIRDIEAEVLGIHLSSTVFERFAEEDRELLREQASAIDHGGEGIYYLGATVSKVRSHIDRSGKTMAFLGLATEVADLDVVVFGGDWAKYQNNLKVGALGIFEVHKNSRGISLKYMTPVI